MTSIKWPDAATGALTGFSGNLRTDPQGTGQNAGVSSSVRVFGQHQQADAGARRLRVGGSRYATALLERLSDDDAHVRAAARTALTRLAGLDAAAGTPDEEVAAKWREEAKLRGWLSP